MLRNLCASAWFITLEEYIPTKNRSSAAALLLKRQLDVYRTCIAWCVCVCLCTDTTMPCVLWKRHTRNASSAAR